MKNFIFLLLFSFGANSQVFELDTTFKFDPISKRYNATEPLITQFANGLLLLNFNGNVFNNELKNSGSFLINDNGKIVEEFKAKAGLSIDYRQENNLQITDNQLIVPNYSSYPTQGLVKVFQNGKIDSSFKFAGNDDYPFKVFLLQNQNFLVFFSTNKGFSYRIFDKNGVFLKNLDLTQLGFKNDSRLMNLIFNDFNDYFLLVLDSEGNGEIIKTNQAFEIDKNFTKIKNKYEEAHTTKLEKDKNDFLLYYAGNKNKIEKYDRFGKKIWETNFDKVSDYTSSTFYHQTDGSLDLIFFDRKHLKLRANGSIDSTFYNNSAQKGVSFLHTFNDGSYWIMQNNSGIIQKMYADGSIDKDFKISLQSEKKMLPNQIEKLPNNNYMVDFGDFPYGSSPYTLRYSPNPNCVRVYNNQHQLLFDFFDSKTIWKSYKTQNSFIIRGDGKFYSIDSNSKMSLSKDTLQVDDVIDWKNNFVYRKNRNDSIIRFKVGVGLDKNFAIVADKIIDFKILNDNRIAVLTPYYTGLYFSGTTFYNMYLQNGLQDATFKTIELDNEIFKFYGGLPTFIESANGININQTTVGEFGNIVRKRFTRYDNDGSFDKNYQQNTLIGGQYVRYMENGTIFTNTATIVEGDIAQKTYNFLKILPNGNIDSTFQLSGVKDVFGFEFFDENTLYATNGTTLNRFIKNSSKKAEYFYFQALPSKIAWNYSYPLKIKINTTLKNININVSGNGILQDSVINIKPQSGIIFINITDENNKILASQTIEVTKVTPNFIYEEPQLTIYSKPYIFKVKSSSGFPVKIRAYGSIFVDSLVIDPIKNPYLTIELSSDGNDQYEFIKKTFAIIILSPLSSEEEVFENISFYPNPVKEKLIIETKTKLDSFRLISIDGKTIPVSVESFEDKYELSVKNVPAGLYLLWVNGKKKQSIFRVWVE